MLLSFTLSMPSNNSWNGKWTGDDVLYVIVRSSGRSKRAQAKDQEILDKGDFSYSFGDGWVAGIKVKEVDSREAARLRKQSKGFRGYDWMVDNIQRHLSIREPATATRECDQCGGQFIPEEQEQDFQEFCGQGCARTYYDK